ncbi:MAG: tripartite tricarboxylate transporter substrate binding protein [Comamonas sp.]|uniref:Bug family tripartite tricarboxylate transporter substrate binding protein n=1 Tax=Comamonas sp. TaxID=34028 RepID=UPI00283326ED|nr:tripartite tricarboxylate transporter substrate binding protein [Comamonas sp.]MDR0214816.1 tripartite tricarboxylate transporter substrate binding protein [Comamonas sp.]
MARPCVPPSVPSSRRKAVQALAAVACGLALLGTAQGQDAWPVRPIRVIVPFPASGATDLVARVIAQRVSQELGQQLIIDNKPGAGGTIGTGEAAKAVVDGYTLLFTTSSTHAISPHLIPRLAYKADKDFTPIAHTADAASVLLVTPSLPVRSVQELIAYAKANPGQLNYATSGNGTIVHLNTAAFAAQAGIQLTHVPYKGTAQSITDLAAGQVQLLFDSIPTGMPHVASGRLRALAVTGDKRSMLAPNLPTVAESGLPGYSSVTWFGVYGPAGMKPELVGRINQAFNRAIQNPEVIASLAKQGVEPAKPQTPAEFAAMVKADSARWAKVIKDNHITLE